MMITNHFGGKTRDLSPCNFDSTRKTKFGEVLCTRSRNLSKARGFPNPSTGIPYQTTHSIQ
ncbi:hypothetical protein PanWU01x14_093670, partial [Parasponia andersonii]